MKSLDALKGFRETANRLPRRKNKVAGAVARTLRADVADRANGLHVAGRTLKILNGEL
jgi:hypothetical protein